MRILTGLEKLRESSTSQIQKEIAAIRADKEFEKRDDRSIDALFDHLDTYPSLIRRFHMLQGKLMRFSSDVRNVPFKIGAFFHRGKHGWAEDDNWSMDYSLTRQLERQFMEFRTHFEGDDAFCGGPVGFAHPELSMDDYLGPDADKLHDDDHRAFVDMIDTIISGFRNYRLNNENGYKIKDIDERIEADRKAHEGVKESFRLIGEHYQCLWW